MLAALLSTYMLIQYSRGGRSRDFLLRPGSKPQILHILLNYCIGACYYEFSGIGHIIQQQNTLEA